MNKILLVFASSLLTFSCYAATNLTVIYNDALQNDPVFKQAEAQFLADKEASPQSLSVLLPQIDFTATGGANKILNSGSLYTSANDSRQKNLDYKLTLTQSIFNYNYWKTLAASNDSVKSANATYNSAAQNLIARAASAYFKVLIAQSVLNTTAAKKRALYQQYIFAKQSFSVGKQTMTDVYSAKASYEEAIAEYISNQNDLDARKEDLRALTNKSYDDLMPLRDKIKLPTPTPNKIDAWVDNAIKNNWQLQASRFTTLASEQTLAATKANHYPTVSLDAQYDNNYTNQFSTSTNGRQTNYGANVAFNLPIFQGGLVSSQTRQALANYDKQINIQDQTYRNVIKSTRQYYLAVIADISKIKADKQSIISNRSSLKGIIEGYKVGTHSMLDVLNAETSLYTAIRNYLTARYTYVLDTVLLKESTGTLSVDDIKTISQWLQAPTNVNTNNTANKDKSKKQKVVVATNTNLKNLPPKNPPVKTTTQKNSTPKNKKLTTKTVNNIKNNKTVMPTNNITTKTTVLNQTMNNANKTVYHLQMAAFKTKNQAENFATELNKKNIPTQIITASKDGMLIYRVKSGPFNKKDADKIIEKYSDNQNYNYKPFITK